MTTGLREEDRELEPKLRPATLESYIGQESVKENMRVFIQAAKQRKEALDHVLLYGPAGVRENYALEYHCKRDGREY